MSFQVRPTRGADCVSDLSFDRMRAGELAAAERTRIKAHLAKCERCRERQALLVRERASFESAGLQNPEWLSGSGVQRVRGPSRRTLVLSSLAAAACVALALQLGLPREGVRAKGAPFVSYFVKRGEQVLHGAQQLQAGDRVRFAYSSARAQYLAILSLDGAARASVYYPADAQAARVEPGSEVLLPSSVELDATLGEERIVAMFCDVAFEVEPLRAALQAAPTSLRAPAGCVSHELRVTKVSSQQ